MSVRPGYKKRRAPLPEEVYPNLANRASIVLDGSREPTITSNEGQPRILPLGEPVDDRRYFVAEDSSTERYSSAANSNISKSTRKNTDDINFLSDNEALDVHGTSGNVKALTDVRKNGRKRHSSEDLSKLLRSSTSRSSLLSLNLSERSISLNSISSTFSTDYVESQMVDQQDIITLTHHVRNFSDALGKLRNAFSGNGSDTESDGFTDNANASEEMQVKAHECLGKVLSNLKEVINQYPSLKSDEILASAGKLISKIKSHNYELNQIPDDFYQSIDQLALVFSSSISDFLMGDQDLSLTKAADGGEDCGDDFGEDGYDEDLSEGDPLDVSLNIRSKQEPRSNDSHDKEADLSHVLLRMESGVDFCLQWTKYWSKYVKDISNYVEKRAQLEAEYTKQLAKLAQTTRASICEENYLPFQSTFFTALDQDLEYSQRCQQTLSAITGSKFMEPLRQRRSVHDRARKDMKDEWTKTCKQLHESEGSVKTSKNMYYKRKQELEKLNTRQGDGKDSKEDSSSVYSVFGTNKGKKEEELRSKVEEAKNFYSNAMEEAKRMQNNAEKTKERIVTQTKQLVNECDRTFRSVTRKYFDMMHDLAVPTPIHFKTLAESCQGYEPGKQFEDFVRFHESTDSFHSSVNPDNRPSVGQLSYDSESLNKMALSPVKAWPSGSQFSDNEYGPSPGVSPSSSPRSSKKSANNNLYHPPPSTDDESGDDSKGGKEPVSKPGKPFKPKPRPKPPASVTKLQLSKDAATHKFHKLRSPAKCSECDSYVFNGVECVQCGLSCHKKCLENLYTACSHSRGGQSPLKRMKTFGVRFPEDGGVPVLVTKCVHEINRRGLRVKGIYRVSGVKSKMEGLCQDFETNADSVDLSAQPPHLIASVLKHYIRQLPEPLMTIKLYPELIQLAKETSEMQWLKYDECKNQQEQNEFKRLLERLKAILDQLPKSNYLTTATLIKHLHKVSNYEQYNQMSPHNLAIVFGPTILRLESFNSITSLSSLVDMPHQTRIVALLILNPQLFDDAGEDTELDQASISDVESEKNEESSLPDTPVEKFVSPKKEEEVEMPDLYGVRSNRVRGEGPSPMAKLQSQSSNIQENTRVDLNSSRINERLDVKGEATTVFDETSISLPGSLERQNKFPEWIHDDDDLSERENDIGHLQNKVVKLPRTDEIGDSVVDGLSRDLKESVGASNSRLPDNEMLIKESQDKENKMVDKTSSANSQNDLLEGHGRETSSSSVSLDGQDEDTVHQRVRTKAFSVGKRTTDPEMLAKRGSALMNAFIDNSVKAEDSEGSFHGSPGRKALNDVHNTPDKISIDGKKIGKNEQTTEVMSSNTPRIPSHLGINTNTGKIEKSNLESKKEMPHNGDDTPSTRGKADISGNSSSMGSGEELGSVLSEGTSRRKRSANYDVDKRRLFENRVERDVKHVTHDRVLAYGIRSRRQRVSVKDQVKQLEQRENDSIRTPPVTTGLHNNAVTSNHLTEKSFLSNVHTVSNVGKIDWKNNSRVERKGEGFPGKATVRVHEPLSRVCVTGGHIEPLGTSETLTIKPPRSPVAHRQPEDEATKFCALKMDISLESSQTPSSNSSEEDHNNSGKEASENVERGRRLATWPGRSLTPRDSNQEPEFV